MPHSKSTADPGARRATAAPSPALVARAVGACIVAVAAVASGASSPTSTNKALEGQVAIADLHVVDCLLPGQVRQLGQRMYLTQRRPTRTTAADCRLRGGEYVAYDRADYKSALNVWMPAAEAGDPEAQTNVGEIFERGLGADPNYEAALIWYRKAAEQGYARAQFNLGTLYEQGLGVPQSTLEALNWYRRAWGLSDDSVIFASAAKREQEALQRRLEQQIEKQRQQLDVLRGRLEELEQQQSSSADSRAAAETEIATLRGLVDDLRDRQMAARAELASIAPVDDPLTREPAGTSRSPVQGSDATEQWFQDVNLGRYYALLIGNSDYRSLSDLRTPLNDIDRARRVLEERYGFEVFTVENGDNVAVMQAINDLYDVVTENDNLLIFYAGHGTRLMAGTNEIGYWLPANAEPPPRNTYWVSNEFVTGHLARFKARSVLIVADSCYAGLLSSEPSVLLVGDRIPSYTDPDFIRFKMDKRARLLLSSGGDAPVLDGSGEGHSVFARAFLDELENNDQVLAAPQLYLKIRDKVRLAATEAGFIQRPEFKAIKAAGHEVGAFLFVPESAR